MQILVSIVVTVLGFTAGWLVRDLVPPKRVGTILAVHDEDGTYLTLQVRDIDDILSEDEVVLKVVSQN